MTVENNTQPVTVDNGPVSAPPAPQPFIYTKRVDPLYDPAYEARSTQDLIKMSHALGGTERQKLDFELESRRAAGEIVIQLPPPEQP